MHALILICSVLVFGILPRDVRAYSLTELEAAAQSKSFELQELKSAGRAARFSSYSKLAEFSPELGAEGNWRYDREKEKRKDLSYYAYGKWNLFRGLKDYQSWAASDELKNATEIRAERAGREINLKVRKAYAEVYFLQQISNLTAEHFKITEDQVQMAKKKINGGLATEADVYEFSIHQTTLKSDQEILETELSEKWQSLESVVGESLDRQRNLENTAPLLISQGADDEWISKGLRLNSAVLDAKATERTASAERWTAFGQLLPTADLQVKYGKLFDSDFIKSRDDSWAIVGTVTIPIFDGFKRLSESRAKSAELDRVRSQTQHRELEAKSSIQLAVQKTKSLSTRLSLEQELLKQSQKYYEITLSEYRRGVKNSPDLANASDRLYDSKRKSLEIQKDLEIAKANLLIATGSNY